MQTGIAVKYLYGIVVRHVPYTKEFDYPPGHRTEPLLGWSQFPALARLFRCDVSAPN